jgi:hypothetical protein
MLHVHNGDSSANKLRRSGLPGEHLAWREALITGPTPEGLPAEEWLSRRAVHLAAAYGLDAAACLKGLAEQEAALRRFPEHEEVTLWFEHDLFCQTLLIYLLDWFSRVDLGETRLSLVCINEFPGKPDFKGLGELSPEQMASLFDARHEVTKAEFRLARRAWEAYCSPDPRAIEDLLGDDHSALPFLRDALLLHLARFPSARNGLGRVENMALELVSAGHNDFVSLFGQFGRAEPVYGLGDLQLWDALKRMSEVRQPLLAHGGRDMAQGERSRDFTKSVFEVTDAGHAVRSGENDFVEMNGIDFWLGGVHLLDERDIWRWNEQEQKLVRTIG